jgi:cytochrome bd-type quinol oxidase subunit 1
MVPVFHLPVLTVVPAIGIALTISYLTKQHHPDVEEKERSSTEKTARLILLAVIYPFFALFIGWIVHKFM